MSYVLQWFEILRDKLLLKGGVKTGKEKEEEGQSPANLKILSNIHSEKRKERELEQNNLNIPEQTTVFFCCCFFMTGFILSNPAERDAQIMLIECCTQTKRHFSLRFSANGGLMVYVSLSMWMTFLPLILHVSSIFRNSAIDS